jgi:hypothetical protein
MDGFGAKSSKPALHSLPSWKAWISDAWAYSLEMTGKPSRHSLPRLRFLINNGEAEFRQGIATDPELTMRAKFV